MDLAPAWRELARPFTYTPKSGSPVSVRGVLAKPRADNLVAGFDESARNFVALHADLVAAGVSTFQRYDGVTDPNDGRQFSVTDVSIRYQGTTPTYVVAEVMG